MTLTQENIYLTCVNDGKFYRQVKEFETATNRYSPDELYRRLQQAASQCFDEQNQQYSEEGLLHAIYAIAKHYEELFPALSKLIISYIKSNKYPEFTTNTKVFLNHKTKVEDLLKEAKDINRKASQLINQQENFNMKYSKGFHTPTIYNNQDVKDLTKEDLMEAIREEKASIKNIEDLKESRTIQVQIKQSEANIAKLLELLDKDFKGAE